MQMTVQNMQQIKSSAETDSPVLLPVMYQLH